MICFLTHALRSGTRTGPPRWGAAARVRSRKPTSRRAHAVGVWAETGGSEKKRTPSKFPRADAEVDYYRGEG